MIVRIFFRYGNGLIALSKLISGITESFNTEFQLTQVPNTLFDSWTL